MWDCPRFFCCWQRYQINRKNTPGFCFFIFFDLLHFLSYFSEWEKKLTENSEFLQMKNSLFSQFQRYFQTYILHSHENFHFLEIEVAKKSVFFSEKGASPLRLTLKPGRWAILPQKGLYFPEAFLSLQLNAFLLDLLKKTEMTRFGPFPVHLSRIFWHVLVNDVLWDTLCERILRRMILQILTRIRNFCQISGLLEAKKIT